MEEEEEVKGKTWESVWLNTVLSVFAAQQILMHNWKRVIQGRADSDCLLLNLHDHHLFMEAMFHKVSREGASSPSKTIAPLFLSFFNSSSPLFFFLLSTSTAFTFVSAPRPNLTEIYAFPLPFQRPVSCLLNRAFVFYLQKHFNF